MHTQDNPLFLTSPRDLKPAERRLFDLLATDPHKVWTKEEIRKALRLQTDRAVDSLAVTLRVRLADWDCRQSPINVWGVGYRLENPSEL